MREQIDWTAVAAISSSIAALAACATLSVLWQERRTKLRAIEEAKAKLWSLEVGKGSVDGLILARLTLHEARENRLHLSEIRVLNWGDFSIAVPVTGRDGLIAAPDPSEFAKVLILDRRLKRAGQFIPGGVHTFEYSDMRLYVRVPSRPWFWRRSSIRLSIELSLEEISARRSRSKRTVTSEAIAWTQRDPTKSA